MSALASWAGVATLGEGMAQRRKPPAQGPGRARGGSAARGGSTAGEAGRSAKRPPAARRAAATGGAKRTPAPQPRRLTGRAAALGFVLLGLLLAYAYPIRVYLSQQAEIARMAAAQEAQRDRIAGLTEQRAKWDDPEYVLAQGRKRFQLVRRGEKTYIVLFDAPGAARDAGGPAAPAVEPPWYGRLWSSIDAANQP